MDQSGGAKRRLRILSTEDDPLVRTMLAELLTTEGPEVEFARNSDDFFRLFGAKAFDLLILDVNISGLNGYQIAHDIGSRLGEKRPKMLILTGRDTQAEKGLIELSGVDAVLEKGGPTGKILETVDKLMALSAPESPPAPKPAAPPEAAGVSRQEFERLTSRISNAVSENASISRRLDSLNARVAESEKTVKALRAEAPTQRLLKWSVALLGLAFAALLLFLRGLSREG